MRIDIPLDFTPISIKADPEADYLARYITQKLEIPEKWVPFPNPANGETILEIPAFNDYLSAAIYSAEGRCVKSHILESNMNSQINLNGLASGCYWLQFKNRAGIAYTKKLIILK
jgi:hypothetical protein